MKSFQSEALDFLKDLVIIVAIVLIIRTFFVMPFQINGASMDESYYDKEFIIVDRFSNRNIPLIGKTREIQRGDVVVFAPGVSDERKYFIKRVIGLPGESLKIEDGKVFIQGVGENNYSEIRENGYLSENNQNNTNVRGDTKMYEYTIPEGSYFVMGDNRNHSSDSRTCFGNCFDPNGRDEYVKEEAILGHVLLDLGYFNFASFSFTQPKLGISSKPRFFNSPSSYNYN